MITEKMKDAERMQKTSLGVRFAKHLYLIPTVCFLFLCIILLARNIPQAISSFSMAFDNDYEERVNLETDLGDNFLDKRLFVDLNGGLANAVGLHILNSVRKLANGFLAYYYYDKVDLETCMRLMKKVDAFLDTEDIPYLWLSIPDKPYFYDASFAPGYPIADHEGVNQLADLCEENGISYLDMDQWFEDNERSMEEIYFKTDHHWRPEGAFDAAEQTMVWLSERGIASYDAQYFDSSSWDKSVYENSWTGSQAERVGSLFAGIDSFSLIKPLFETEYQVWALTTPGGYVACSESPFLEIGIKAGNLYDKELYTRYMGGNYPLAVVTNQKAVNDMRVLVIGDSFRLSYEAFLTTQFAELWHMDCRVWKEGNFACLVKSLQPDLVLILNSGPGIHGIAKVSTDLNDWNVVFQNIEENSNIPKQVVSEECWERISIPKTLTVRGENDSTNKTLVKELPSGCYCLRVNQVQSDRIEDEKGTETLNNMPFVQFSLVDDQTGEALDDRYFFTAQSGYKEGQDWYFIIPEEKVCSIRVFAGVQLYTKNIMTEVDQMILYQYKTE